MSHFSRTWKMFTDVVCIVVPVLSSTIKSLVFIFNKRTILKLDRFAREHFWQPGDNVQHYLLKVVDEKAVKAVKVYVAIVNLAALAYSITPYFGKYLI